MRVVKRYWPIAVLVAGLLLTVMTWRETLSAPILGPLLIAVALVGAALHERAR